MDFFEFNGIKITVILDARRRTMVDRPGGLQCPRPGKRGRPSKASMMMKRISITLSNINRRGTPKRTIINEPGLYNLISKSTKPEAKEFSRWIRHEVLPTIRRTGRYSIQGRQRSNGAKIYKEAVQHLLVQIEENEKLIAINTNW